MAELRGVGEPAGVLWGVLLGVAAGVCSVGRCADGIELSAKNSTTPISTTPSTTDLIRSAGCAGDPTFAA